MAACFLSGLWQPENTHATSTINQPTYGDTSNPFLPLTWWGEDVRISYFNQPNSQWPEIAAIGNYLYIAWWYMTGDTIYFARSVDGGYNWINRRLSDDSTRYAVVPIIAASDSHVYVAYKAARPWYGLYFQTSSDFGESWHSTQTLYYTVGENYAENASIASKDSFVYVSANIQVIYPPNQDWDMWLFRSRNFGQTFPDTFYVSDSTCSGLAPDMAVNNLGLHIIRGLNLRYVPGKPGWTREPKTSDTLNSGMAITALNH